MSEPAAKPKLEFGQLGECPRCGRRKLEPGAPACPDCTAIGHLVSHYGTTLDDMHRRWRQGRRVSHLVGMMADDPRYESFKTLDELMDAYWRWSNKQKGRAL